MPGSGVHFAVPRLVIVPSPSRATSAYFRAWGRLPYVRNSPVTYGVYAVSAEGRRRWSELPLIHSDDSSSTSFVPAERRVVFDATGRGGAAARPAAPCEDETTLSGGEPRTRRCVSGACGGRPRRRTGSLRALMSVPWASPSAAVFVLLRAGRHPRGAAAVIRDELGAISMLSCRRATRRPTTGLLEIRDRPARGRGGERDRRRKWLRRWTSDCGRGLT